MQDILCEILGVTRGLGSACLDGTVFEERVAQPLRMLYLYAPPWPEGSGGIKEHTSAYVSIRHNLKHTSAHVSIRQQQQQRLRSILISVQLISVHNLKHTSAYVSIRQHTSAYVSIQHTCCSLVARQATCNLNTPEIKPDTA
jgi:hypothetical protein